MFYAHIVLAKKGPLGRIWLAAHWDKKLTKAHVFETNIEQSIDGIMQPKVKLALRTSGHLLLGVARIHSRKAKYLLADCNEAFVKIKMAFRPGMVDLPEEHREAAVNAITLPEVFHDFDTALPELNDVDIEAHFSINQSRADEITMREDYGSLPMNMHDDGFGDLDSPDLVRDEASANIDDDLFSDPMHQTTTLDNTKEPGTSRSLLDTHPIDDDFGEDFGESANLFGGDIFGDTAAADESQITNQGNMTSRSDDSDDDVGHFDGASPALSSTSSRPPSTIPPLNNINRFDSTNPQDNSYLAVLNQPEIKDEPLPTNDEESFALAPIDATALKGVTKTKRKRKLIIDEGKNISGEEMKAQLANTADIITSLDLAPPTKKLMNWKETGGVEKLFALPSRFLPARALSKIYQINLLSTSALSEDFSILGPPDILALDQNTLSVLTDTPTKRGRKRKNNEHDGNDTNDLPDPIRDIHEFPPQTPAPVELKGDLGLDTNQTFGSELMPPPSSVHLTSPRQSMLHMNSLASPSNHMPMTPGNFSSLDDNPMLHDPSLPNLNAETVSSILDGNGEMDNQFANMGYDASPGGGISERIANDWNDYDYPPSVDNSGEEQMVDESIEQFEERVLNKRAAQLFVTVRAKLLKEDKILLSDMTYRNTKKQAAQKFYSLLVLKKFQMLEIEQEQPFAEIVCSRGNAFDENKTI